MSATINYFRHQTMKCILHFKWCLQLDSNQQPITYHAIALFVGAMQAFDAYFYESLNYASDI